MRHTRDCNVTQGCKQGEICNCHGVETKRKILSGHVSPETAYIVNDYPYGFRLRCKIRYWLEHNPKKGTRMWLQTTNPKVEAYTDKQYWPIWNKPKCSTYSFIAGCMYLDDDEHIQWSGLSEYSDHKETKEWLEIYGSALPPTVFARVQGWAESKRIYEAKATPDYLREACKIWNDANQ